jgi:hypothetical protein
VIVPPKAEAIGLRVNNYIKLHRVGGIDEQVPVYTAAIRLNSPQSSSFFIPKIKLIGCALPGQAADCLLGRDVLSVCSYSHEGTSGLWRLEVPDTRVPLLQLDF